MAAAAAEANAAEDTADAPEARPPRTQLQTPVKRKSIVIEDNKCADGSEAAAERQIALLEALNNRLEAALLKEERETKA